MSNEEMVEQIRSGSGDRQELLQRLYEVNKGIIYRTVKTYISGGMEEQDAMQEAFLGLLEAVERYDPDRGSFISCLCLWVRAVVGKWHSATSEQKRIPVHMRNRIRKYLKIMQEWQQATGEDPPDPILRHELGISQEQLQDMRRAIREMDPVSLSDPVPGAEDLTIGDCLPDPLEDVEEQIIETVDAERDAVRIWETVDSLPDKQPEILRSRYKQQRSVRQTGENLDLTPAQVRLGEYKALRKLRHNWKILQIVEDGRYCSQVYKGGLQRFRNSGSSIEEYYILKRMQF